MSTNYDYNNQYTGHGETDYTGRIAGNDDSSQSSPTNSTTSLESENSDEDSLYADFNFVKSSETEVEDTKSRSDEVDYSYDQPNIYEYGSNTSYNYESNQTSYYSNHYPSQGVDYYSNQNTTNGDYSDGSTDSKSSDPSDSNYYAAFDHVIDVRSVNSKPRYADFDDTDLDSDSDYAEYMAGLSRKRRDTVELSNECLEKYKEGDESCLCDDLMGKFRLTIIQ